MPARIHQWRLCAVRKLASGVRAPGAAAPSAFAARFAAAQHSVRAVSQILCPVKVVFRVVASWGRDDLNVVNAATPFPKPL